MEVSDFEFDASVRSMNLNSSLITTIGRKNIAEDSVLDDLKYLFQFPIKSNFPILKVPYILILEVVKCYRINFPL